MMSKEILKGNCNFQTCLCCMCRCGDHSCFQQQVMKLPLPMQLELRNRSAEHKTKEGRSRSQSVTVVPQSDLYKKTTYKRDFCEQQNLIDHFLLEQKKCLASIKLDPASLSNRSIYRDDFMPWSKEEQNLCRAKLHVPDHALEKVPEDEVEAMQISDELYNYYCPPHCVGDHKDIPPENCLVDHKDRFNLGPPTRRKEHLQQVSRHPFTKFTNYMLDFKKTKPFPKEQLKQKKYEVSKGPMSSTTTHRADFPCPRKIHKKMAKREGQPPTLKVGDGPMLQQTSSMLDYKDPNVAVHKPVRHPREIFRIPTCRMETETITGASYPRWKNLPNQERSKVQKETSYKSSEGDIRRLVTTYQEDFSGLNSALCPGKCVEKYGPKSLEPRYRYTSSRNKHDFFDCNKKVVRPQQRDCPH